MKGSEAMNVRVAVRPRTPFLTLETALKAVRDNNVAFMEMGESAGARWEKRNIALQSLANALR